MRSMKLFKNRFFLIAILVALGFVSCKSSKEEPARILTIGDSNGAFEHGWVNQLQKLMPEDSIYNVSVPGNTIGFDNLDNPGLNTLKNLDSYIEKTLDKAGHLDYILILLGTNDSKAVFRDQSKEVLDNLGTLIKRIKRYDYRGEGAPEIVLITPPPYGPDSILADKYIGGEKRVASLVEEYRGIARKTGCEYVNIHDKLKAEFMDHSTDGVHLDAEGQKIIAKTIKEHLDK